MREFRTIEGEDIIIFPSIFHVFLSFRTASLYRHNGR